LLSKALMLKQYPILSELAVSLADSVPHDPVDFRGEWGASTRRAYQREARLGTGSGPFVEVVDVRWIGALTSSAPIVGVAFLLTPEALFWSKSAPASLDQPVCISLHAYAEYSPQRATFATSVGGTYLPGIPVAVEGELRHACRLGASDQATGDIARLACIDEVSLVVLILPAASLKSGVTACGTSDTTSHSFYLPPPTTCSRIAAVAPSVPSHSEVQHVS
jgi:hypothetical protein